MDRIDAKAFRAMVSVGGDRLFENAEYVNSLNVFPVPDGDTGTNMNLSFTSGVEHVSNKESVRVDESAQALSKGLLMGARGNSGVILSQLFRGFAKATEGKEALTAGDLATAFENGVKTAYKAVMKPVEGTILTVAREAAEAGKLKAEESTDVIDVMTAVFEGAKVSLANTPNLLAVLKEVGVVDSGGQGLVYIYQGFLESLTGKAQPIEYTGLKQTDVSELAHRENFHATSHSINTEDILFGYCTEIMVQIGVGKTVTDEFDYDTFRNYLNDLGDSLLVVADDEIIKVHVHTEHPGQVLEYGQKFGSLMKIKVDNMREQHDAILEQDGLQTAEPADKGPKKEFGIITICSGSGIQALFEGLGANYTINGGQTMNPSTEDIVKAIDEVNADHVFVLPNNKNILMAANQASEVSDKHVVIIPTTTVLQGLAVMLGFNETATVEENEAAMNELIATVKSGQITYAVRDTQIDGIDIHKNDYMGIVDGKIVTTAKDVLDSLKETIVSMIDEDSEIATIIVGETGSLDEASALISELENDYDIEFEIYDGQQPVYDYYISVE